MLLKKFTVDSVIKISPKALVWEKYSKDGYVKYQAPPLEYPYMGIITGVHYGIADLDPNALDEGFNVVPPEWSIRFDFLHGPHEYSYTLYEGSAISGNIEIELVTE